MVVSRGSTYAALREYLEGKTIENWHLDFGDQGFTVFTRPAVQHVTLESVFARCRKSTVSQARILDEGSP